MFDGVEGDPNIIIIKAQSQWTEWLTNTDITGTLSNRTQATTTRWTLPREDGLKVNNDMEFDYNKEAQIAFVCRNHKGIII